MFGLKIRTSLFQQSVLTAKERRFALEKLNMARKFFDTQSVCFAKGFFKELGKTHIQKKGPIRLRGEAQAYRESRRASERVEELHNKIVVNEALCKQDLVDLNYICKPRIKINWFKLF